MQRGSPEYLAWEAASRIDMLAVEELADRAADQAAYGRPFPQDGDEYLRLLTELAIADAPRDGSAWGAARKATLREGHYPEEEVAAWFTNARIARPEAATNFSQRCGMACEKFNAAVLAEGVQKSVLEGPADLRKLLSDIAATERRLAKQLRQLLGEARRPGHAATDRGSQIRAIYEGVFLSLIDGLAKAAHLRQDEEDQLVSLLRPEIRVEGNHYISGGRLGWETGLRRSAAWLTRLVERKQFWVSLPLAGRPPSPARAQFIHDMSEIWKDCTGAPATFSDTSPFYLFMRSAYGHMRGLREAANPDKIKERWQSLRLGSIPTATTMKSERDRFEIKLTG